ncbi:hypothetical protein ABT354_11105 [Streptomyces sp. NPDC000594]|uniref:hypothetical protein n=1 Tax=Streptomyces sp. NPDC000594 TaxID=3154261 RepID=UPI00331702D4
MSGWRYEVWVCDSGYTRPDEHDGSCGLWQGAGVHWNEKWFGAFEEAARHGHATVQAVPVGIDLGWKPYQAFEHVQGGGLCKGCWARHELAHTKHAVDAATGLCRTCVEVTQQRRGPLTRTPFGPRFMCEECRSGFRRMHESANRDPDPRVYRPVLDVSREDSEG